MSTNNADRKLLRELLEDTDERLRRLERNVSEMSSVQRQMNESIILSKSQFRHICRIIGEPSSAQRDRSYRATHGERSRQTGTQNARATRNADESVVSNVESRDDDNSYDCRSFESDNHDTRVSHDHESTGRRSGPSEMHLASVSSPSPTDKITAPSTVSPASVMHAFPTVAFPTQSSVDSDSDNDADGTSDIDETNDKRIGGDAAISVSDDRIEGDVAMTENDSSIGKDSVSEQGGHSESLSEVSTDERRLHSNAPVPPPNRRRSRRPRKLLRYNPTSKKWRRMIRSNRLRSILLD